MITLPVPQLMTKFYICTKDAAKGPYHLTDIDTLNIDGNDLIWSDEYGENRKAIQVPELKAYFRKKTAGMITATQKNNYSIAKNIVLAVLLFVLALMIGYYFATN